MDLNIPVETMSADFGLLYLYMQLLVGERLPPALQNSQKTFYADVRECHFLVESAGILSLHLLQAGLLLAVNEFGHAIFPAAYITIGRCARIGMQSVFTMGQAHLPFSVLQRAGQRRKSEAGCGGQCFYLIGYYTLPYPSRCKIQIKRITSRVARLGGSKET